MLQAGDLIFQQCAMVVRMLASELEWMIPSSWKRLKNLLVLSARILSYQARRDQFHFFRRDGFILSDFRHVDLHESCSEIKSNHCSFQGNDFPFYQFSSLTSVGTNPGHRLLILINRISMFLLILISSVSIDILNIF